jgi:hypothetical protein
LREWNSGCDGGSYAIGFVQQTLPPPVAHHCLHLTIDAIEIGSVARIRSSLSKGDARQEHEGHHQKDRLDYAVGSTRTGLAGEV